MKKQVFLVLASVLLLSNFAYAALIDNTGGFIYDSNLNVTWYDYSKMVDTWSNQKAWAASLTVGNTVAGTWRLPITPGTISGYTSEGEMGHLYYVELGKPMGGPLGSTTPFTNLVPGGAYWLGSEYSSNTSDAWLYDLTGRQFTFDKGGYAYALAVHSGDIGPNGLISQVPIPGALWLFVPGLFGLTGLRRKYLG